MLYNVFLKNHKVLSIFKLFYVFLVDFRKFIRSLFGNKNQ